LYVGTFNFYKAFWLVANLKILQTGKWKVRIQNPTNTTVNVIYQVESTARVVNTPTQDSSSNTNSDDEDMLPITVRTLIVNEEPDFNTTGNETCHVSVLE